MINKIIIIVVLFYLPVDENTIGKNCILFSLPPFPTFCFLFKVTYFNFFKSIYNIIIVESTPKKGNFLVFRFPEIISSNDEGCT